jgi:hypothetical protein
MCDYYNDTVSKLNANREKKGKARYIPLLFCFAFVITGVWYPDYFMWVVYAFAAYMALIVGALILVGLILLAVRLMVRYASNLESWD